MEEKSTKYLTIAIFGLCAGALFGTCDRVGLAHHQNANAAEIDHLFDDLAEMELDLRAAERRFVEEMESNSYAYEEGWDDGVEMMGDPPYEDGC